MIWGNAAQTNLQPLKVLVNKAIRIMTFVPFGSIDLSPVYKKLKLLELQKYINWRLENLHTNRKITFYQLGLVIILK